MMEQKTLAKEFSFGKPLPILKVCIEAITILLTKKDAKWHARNFNLECGLIKQEQNWL